MRDEVRDSPASRRRAAAAFTDEHSFGIGAVRVAQPRSPFDAVVVGAR